MKSFAIKINDFLVGFGLFVIILFTFFALVGGAGWLGLVFGVCALVAWAIGAGLWCVLSGIYDELKKINKGA